LEISVTEDPKDKEMWTRPLLVVSGRLMRDEVTVMIDSGSSANFIARKLVRRLKVELEEPQQRIRIRLADRRYIFCHEIARQLHINIRGMCTKADYW
jgi:hypothetical protein